MYTQDKVMVYHCMGVGMAELVAVTVAADYAQIFIAVSPLQKCLLSQVWLHSCGDIQYY